MQQNDSDVVRMTAILEERRKLGRHVLDGTGWGLAEPIAEKFDESFLAESLAFRIRASRHAAGVQRESVTRLQLLHARGVVVTATLPHRWCFRSLQRARLALRADYERSDFPRPAV